MAPICVSEIQDRFRFVIAVVVVSSSFNFFFILCSLRYDLIFFCSVVLIFIFNSFLFLFFRFILFPFVTSCFHFDLLSIKELQCSV